MYLLQYTKSICVYLWLLEIHWLPLATPIDLFGGGLVQNKIRYSKIAKGQSQALHRAQDHFG
jgi:hypothetical protein